MAKKGLVNFYKVKICNSSSSGEENADKAHSAQGKNTSKNTVSGQEKNETENVLFELWTKQWEVRTGLTKDQLKQSEAQTAKNCEMDEIKQKQYMFYKRFEDSYDRASRKIIENKEWNFGIKEDFIKIWTGLFFVQVAIVVILIISQLIALKSGNNILPHVALIEGIFLLLLIFVSVIISKILDVYKFQETWSRHTYFQFLREQEMLRFIGKDGDYARCDDVECANRFIENMMKIEEKNIEKFCLNMDTKEKNLLEGIESFVKTGLSGGE